MKTSFLIAFVTGLLAAALVWLFGGLVPRPATSPNNLELLILLIAGGALLVSLLTGLTVAGTWRRTSRLAKGLEMFEQEVTRRLHALEKRQRDMSGQSRAVDAPVETRAPPDEGQSDDTISENSPGHGNGSFHDVNGARNDHMPMRMPYDNELRKRGADEPDSAAQPAQRDIEDAIRADGLTPWFLPIVALPERATRYLQAIAYLQLGSGAPIPQQDWLVQARRRRLVGEIDLAMLRECIALARQLKRSGKSVVVICRINRDTLSRSEWRKPVIKMLEANTAVNKRLALEIPLAEFLKLKVEAREKLAGIRQAGYSLMLSECGELDDLRRAVESDLFDLVSVDSRLLVAGGAAGDMAHLASLREKLGKNAAIVAAGVETEDIAIEMIDNDILLAQGPLFSVARPLKDRAAPGGTARAADRVLASS